MSALFMRQPAVNQKDRLTERMKVLETLAATVWYDVYERDESGLYDREKTPVSTPNGAVLPMMARSGRGA